MNRFISSLALLFIFNFSYSQPVPYSKEMVVTNAELQQVRYPADTTANALILFEKGNSYVDKKTYKLITEITRKVKIFNRKGFDYATISIPLYQDLPRSETVAEIKGVTYNLENGNITKTELQSNGIFEEKYNTRYNIKKFTFPNVQEGSVITYSYRITSPFFFNYHEWEFQDNIPTVHSEYHTSIPANWDYHIQLVGLLDLESQDKNIERHCLNPSQSVYSDCTNTIYIMKNIPAFKEEDYMTTRGNYLSRIDYELMTFQGFDGRKDNINKTWKSADQEIKLDTDLGKELRKGGAVKDLLIEIGIESMPPMAKAEKIYEFVQGNYNMSEATELFNNLELKKLIKEKSGSATEINILLHNLLEESEIKVKPVLISTRENGLATKLFPKISDFNFLLVQVEINGETYLLDASNDKLSFGEIPFKALNQYGRLLDFKGESEWIDIEPKKLSLIQQRTELHLDSENNFEGSIKSRKAGYHSLGEREAYFNNPTEYVNSIKNTTENPEVLDHQIIEGTKNSFILVEELKVRLSPEVIGDKILLNPFIFKMFKENPFKLQERTYPIDFGFRDTFISSTKITYTDEYEVESVPDNFSLALPNNTGTLMFSIEKQNKAIEVYLKFDFKQPIYNPEFYPYIKKFFSEIVNIEKNSLIVLKKK